MSDLIKEAIADAKLVREMAVKQAKAALEEAFTPRVEKIVSQRLQTEMEDEEAEYEDEEMEEAISPETGVELGTDDDHEEAQENSGLTEEADTSDIGDGDNKEPSKASSEETTEDPGGTQDVQADHDTAKESDLTESEDFDEDDVDLEEIIAELEDEADEFEDDEFEDEDEGEFEDGGDDEVEFDVDVDDEGGEEEVEADFGDETEDEFEDDDEDEVEEELELEIEDDTDDEWSDEEETEDELDLESVVASNQINKLRSENAKLKAKLGEAIKAVKIQKNQLNEINILNAKLLFTNKVFGQYNLDDSSKIKVVENFDRAKNIREVKLIFATLMENMKAEKRNDNKVQRLSEGASAVISSTKPKVNENIVEQDDVRARVRKLANIKDK